MLTPDILYDEFQLTRLMRGVTYNVREFALIRTISTHTPHARRDVDSHCLGFGNIYFNSHASCEA